MMPFLFLRIQIITFFASAVHGHEHIISCDLGQCGAQLVTKTKGSVLLPQAFRGRLLSSVVAATTAVSDVDRVTSFNATYGVYYDISAVALKAAIPSSIFCSTPLCDSNDNELLLRVHQKKELNDVMGLDNISNANWQVATWETGQSDNLKHLRGYHTATHALRAHTARTFFILVSFVVCLLVPAAMGSLGSGRIGTVNNADQVARKAAELVPGWGKLQSFNVEQLHGASKMVFKLTCSVDSRAACVRVLRPARDHKLLDITRALATAELVPEIIGASSCALVQRFIDGRVPAGLRAEDDYESSTHSAVRLGRFVGKFHSTPLDLDRTCDKRDLCDIARAALPDDAAEFKEEVHRLFRDLPRDESELVPTHGDLHYGNILECGDQLWAIDLESVALRPAVTDIAYLFISSSMASDSKTYPSLATRREFAKAYLAERGKRHDAENVDQFLFVVECEWPMQFFWQVCLLILAVPSRRSSAATMLKKVPRARELLMQVFADPSRQFEVVKYGVGQLTGLI